MCLFKNFLTATVVSELGEMFFMTIRQVFCSEIERKLESHSQSLESVSYLAKMHPLSLEYRPCLGSGGVSQSTTYATVLIQE